jgi:glycerophosphoryl diester phosphodiesterase
MSSPTALRAGLTAPAPDLPLGFAHRGGALHRRQQNTLPAFAHSIRLGATGIESDVELTADGVAVLVHPGIVARLRRPVSRLRRAALPASVPTVEEMYAACGPDLDVALDMAAPAAAAQVVAIAREHGDVSRLWLTYWRVETLAAWRQEYADVRLVYPTMLLGAARARRRATGLRAAGVDALNLHYRTCTVAVTTATQEAGLLLFGWGARTGAAAARVLRNGADGVFCDDTAGMVAAIARERRRQATVSAPR